MSRALVHDGETIPTFDRPKDPDSVLDYQYDWSEWLVSGETILTSTWLTDDVFDIDADTAGTTTTTVWLSGGTLGETGVLTNRITTTLNGSATGRTMDGSFRLNCLAT